MFILGFNKYYSRGAGGKMELSNSQTVVYCLIPSSLITFNDNLVYLIEKASTFTPTAVAVEAN